MLWVLRLLVFILFIAALCAGGVMWRLAQGPVDIGFARETLIENLLPRLADSGESFDDLTARGVTLKVGEMTAAWPDLQGPVVVDIHDVALEDQQDSVLTLRSLEIKLAKTPLLIALVRPEAIEMDGIDLTLKRVKNGQLSLLPTNRATKIEEAKPTDDTPLPDLAQIGAGLFEGHNLKAAKGGSMLSHLKKVELKGAKVTIADENGAVGLAFSDIHLKIKRTPHSFDLVTDYRLLHSADIESSLGAGLESRLGAGKSQESTQPIYTSSLVIKFRENNGKVIKESSAQDSSAQDSSAQSSLTQDSLTQDSQAQARENQVLGNQAPENQADDAGNYLFSAYFRHMDSSVVGKILTDYPELAHIQAVLNGHISAALDRNWRVKTLRAKLSSQEDREGDDQGGEQGEGERETQNPENAQNPQSVQNTQTAATDGSIEKLAVAGVFGESVVFSDLALNIRYDADHNILEAQDSHIKINNEQVNFTLSRRADDQASGTRVNENLNQDPDQNQQAQNILPLEIKIPALKLRDIQLLWPMQYRDGLAAEWLTNKLKGAEFKNLVIFIPLPLKNLSALDTEKIEGSFDYSGLHADYNAPMIPVEGGQGRAQLKDDILTIDINGGRIDQLAVKQGKVTITHLTHPVKIGEVTIDAALTGPLASAIRYINGEPINMASKLGLDPATIKGSATITANVKFPAAKHIETDQVKVNVSAQLNQVTLPKIAQGLDLSGGPYMLKLDEKMITVSGKGAIEGRAIDLKYQEYLDHSSTPSTSPSASPYVNKIEAHIDLDESLRQKLGIDLSDFVAGSFPVDVEYQQIKDGDADLSFTADLKNADFYLTSLGYSKPRGLTGTAKGNVSIRAHKPQKISDLTLNIGDDVTASGDLSFGQVGGAWGVKSAQFQKIKLGTYHDFAMMLTAIGKNQYQISVTGAAFDASHILNGQSSAGPKNSQKSAPSPTNQPIYDVNLKTSRVYTDSSKGGAGGAHYLSNPSIKVKTNQSGDLTYLDLTGEVSKGRVSIQLKPGAKNGRMELSMSSDNAGETLKIFGVYDNMVGGNLMIKGRQIKGGGVNDIAGRAEITKFAIVRAPILAKFINLFSLSGLSELLQNKGIEFSKLRSEFMWKQDRGNKIFVFKNGRTAGASIGLSFEGTINQTRKTIDLGGTVVPVSEINSLVAKVPVLGKFLGGSSGGLIAATYSMKGDADNPQTFINPLSVLAPGFIRSLLFENDKSLLDDEEDDAPPAQPARSPSSKPRYNR